MPERLNPGGCGWFVIRKNENQINQTCPDNGGGVHARALMHLDI
jgi:hypothetical protein